MLAKLKLWLWLLKYKHKGQTEVFCKTCNKKADIKIQHMISENKSNQPLNMLF